jgi:uncharacterized membrane protein
VRGLRIYGTHHNALDHRRVQIGSVQYGDHNFLASDVSLRYSGTPLWNVRGQPLVHELVWGLSFVSFFFLYPSTFNLLEV